MGRVAFGGQAIDLRLLFTELAVGGGKSGYRCILPGLRLGCGPVGLLLGQPRRRLLVDLFGAGPLQVGHHLPGAGGQRPASACGGDDVVGAGRGQVAVGRPVDVSGGREGVESPLGSGDGRVGVLHRPLTDLNVMLCGRSVVARGLHVDQCLVDAFLFGLNGAAEVLQVLVGLGHLSDQGRQ